MPEQTTQLCECVPARLLDRQDGFPRSPRVFAEEETRRPRLDGHERDRMGDHVVELARDSAPLLGDRGPLGLFSLAFEARGPLLELGCALAPPLQRVGDEGHDASEEDPGDGLLES